MCDRTKNNVFYLRDTRERKKKKREVCPPNPWLKNYAENRGTQKLTLLVSFFSLSIAVFLINIFFFFPNNQTELKKNMQWDLKAWIFQWTNKKINPYINYQEYLPKIVKKFPFFLFSQLFRPSKQSFKL